MRRWTARRGVRLVAWALLVCAGVFGHLAAVERVEALDPATAANQLVALTNVNRTSNGLPALPQDSRLSLIATARSEDMIARKYFSHSIPPDNRTVVDIMESLGVRMRSASENIAWNNALDFNTIQVADGDFMNSPSHRVNVLNGRWHRLGAGVAQGDGRLMYTVVFLQLPSGDIPASAAPAQVASPAAADPARRPGLAEDQVQVASAPTGLMDSLVNRSLRLFLNL